MWDLPTPGLEPVSPALAGGFLTTAPPGKPVSRVLKYPTIIVFLSVSPFMSVSICFIYVGAPILRACMLMLLAVVLVFFLFSLLGSQIGRAHV